MAIHLAEGGCHHATKDAWQPHYCNDDHIIRTARKNDDVPSTDGWDAFSLLCLRMAKQRTVQKVIR